MPQKWMKVATQKHHAEHLERIKSMKCSVDCNAPRDKIEKNRTVEKVSLLYLKFCIYIYFLIPIQSLTL